MDWCKQKWVNLKAHTIHGRLNRWRYFLWGIGYNLIPGIPMLLIAVLMIWASMEYMVLLTVLGYLLELLQLVFCVLLLIGRLHDLNLSGWYTVGVYAIIGSIGLLGEMIGIICTVIGLILLLFFTFKRGTVGPNRFGPDPVDEPWKKEEKKG